MTARRLHRVAATRAQHVIATAMTAAPATEIEALVIEARAIAADQNAVALVTVALVTVDLVTVDPVIVDLVIVDPVIVDQNGAALKVVALPITVRPVAPLEADSEEALVAVEAAQALTALAQDHISARHAARWPGLRAVTTVPAHSTTGSPALNTSSTPFSMSYISCTVSEGQWYQWPTAARLPPAPCPAAPHILTWDLRL